MNRHFWQYQFTIRLLLPFYIGNTRFWEGTVAVKNSRQLNIQVKKLHDEHLLRVKNKMISHMESRKKLATQHADFNRATRWSLGSAHNEDTFGMSISLCDIYWWLLGKGYPPFFCSSPFFVPDALLPPLATSQCLAVHFLTRLSFFSESLPIKPRKYRLKCNLIFHYVSVFTWW